MRIEMSRYVKKITILKHMLIIAFATLMLYPLLWMFITSFKSEEKIFVDSGLWSNSFTLDNYIYGWQGMVEVSFATFFTNSLMLAAITILGNILTCAMTAYAFARLKFVMKAPLFGLMLLTMMLPQHVMTIPQYLIFSKLNWINTYLPLIIPKFAATDGFFIYLMIQFMRSIPSELDQAARVDGCGVFQIFWWVVYPLTLPALVTTAILTFIGTWNDFLGQMLYISDIYKYTVALGLRLFLDINGGESHWGSLFAMSSLSLVPVFFIFIFFQKFLMEGITSGGVKG